MDMSNLVIHNALVALKADLNNGKKPIGGICVNLIFYVEEYQPIYSRDLSKLICSWPDIYRHSDVGADRVYPVGGYKEYFIRNGEFDTISMALWDNPRRHALLDWMINELS